MATSSSVPAASHALAILRYLAAQAGPVPAAAIARDLGLPRSSVYHLLAVLEQDGFAVHLPEERRYGLGVSAFELGSAYSRQAPLARLARPVLARLVDTVHESAHLAVLHGREVLYVVEERARGRPPLVSDVGVRLPAQLTASGRAILADLPRAQVRALFPGVDAFVDRHGAGPTTPSALRSLLVDVRRTGYATEHGEVTPGFASVAVAVADHTGHPVAGLAITFPTDDGMPDGAAWAAYAAAAGRAAATLRERIGGRTPEAGVRSGSRRS
ncbi:IclR family transcriptional regulator [Occultella kanbiaonis]|uniref:IclR family transcriptional regulator n=1 Tax=Occultella kanbiaonis TaxID=2675754 RepID=UPI0013D8D452|nr:IclR family transcriptional regulator [Occultella kanbiaonis]